MTMPLVYVPLLFSLIPSAVHLNQPFCPSVILVKYPKGVKSVTPGQECVLYDNNRCIGGGIIKEVRKDGKKLWYL